MEKDVLKLANLLYQTWLDLHDPYMDDFLTDVLEIHCPNIKWAFSTDRQEIIIL